MELSLIIPCYNVEKYINRCMQSIFDQTFKDFEVIFVNDGSTDNTEIVILNSMKGSNIEFKYILQKNAGPAAARNKGILNSKGKYIAFLDSDDWLSEDSLEKRYKCLKNSETAEVIYSNATIVYENQFESINKSTFKDKYNTFYSGRIFSQLIMRNFIPMPTVMVKRELFDKFGMFDEKLKGIEDYDMWLRLARNKVEFQYLDDILASYLVRDFSLSSCNDEMNEKVIKLFEDLNYELHGNFFLKLKIKKRINNIKFDSTVYRILTNINKGNFKKVSSDLLILLKYKFLNPIYYYLILLFKISPEKFISIFNRKFQNHNLKLR